MIRSQFRRGRLGVCLSVFTFVGGSVAVAQTPPDPIQTQLAALRAEYEGRIAQLEGKVSTLEHRLETEGSAARDGELGARIDEVGRRGLRDLGQTTSFSNVFNPAISVVSDFVFSWSDRKDSREELNRLRLREVELGITGRVDPSLAYYVFLHFEPGEVELEEGYGIADDWLPDTFSLKFGRYNVDFGKLSPIHDAELPFVDKPGVLQEYVGGSLRGTGVELHHWFGLGDSGLLRWSVGVINAPEGDSHPTVSVGGGGHEHAHGEDEEELAGIGKRSIDDFALTARATAVFDLSATATLQVGASLVWAPHLRDFEAVLEAADGPPVGEPDPLVRFDRAKRVIGTDLSFRWRDPTTGEGLTLGAELLFNRERFEAEEEEVPALFADSSSGPTFRQSSLGFYLMGEYAFDRTWSLGASFDWFERATDDDLAFFDVGAFLTWNINEFNRLRLEVRYFEDDLFPDDFTVAMIQWTAILGSHGHGLPW